MTPPPTRWLLLVVATLATHASATTNTTDLAQYCTGERKSTDVIVYLGQKQHSSYDSTHKNTLNASMESLRLNMLKIRESDVIVWHEGDLTPADATALDGHANVRFCLLTEATGWGPPKWLPVIPESKFSAGYRFMIRFYAVTIWTTLHSLGYKWVMRMDDDSFVLSPVTYNIFHDMRNRGLLYGYRMLSKECPTIFGDFVDSYAAQTDERTLLDFPPLGTVGPGPTERIAPTPARPPNVEPYTSSEDAPDVRADRSTIAAVETSPALDDESKHVIKFCGTWPRHCRKASMREALMQALRKAQLVSGEDVSYAPVRKKARPFSSWYCQGPGRLGYYNNWFVTDVDWWRGDEKAARMIAAFDRSNLIFTRRCNDLIFQTAAIKLFMPKSKRRRYVDFTYQHHTVSGGLVTFGGIETGYDDPQARHNLHVYKQKHIPERQRRKVEIETCLVQAEHDGDLTEIHYISPASLRQRDDADSTSVNTVVARFESPYCGPDGKAYLT